MHVLSKTFFYINVLKYRFLIKKNSFFKFYKNNKRSSSYYCFKDHDCYGWWEAKLNSVVGFVPKNYLMNAYDVQVK